MGNHTSIKAKKGDASVDFIQHQSDSPILPVAQIERLAQFAPERVAWVFNQTQIEAEQRRRQDWLSACFVFAERMLGLIAATALCGAALYIAYLVATAGHDWPAVVIGSTCPIGLAGAFLFHRRK